MPEVSGRESRNNGGGQGFVAGLLCGAAVGVVAGLLFAPKRGAALRKDLAKSANNVARQARALYDGAADVVSDLSDRATAMLEPNGKSVEKVTAHSRSEHHGRSHS